MTRQLTAETRLRNQVRDLQRRLDAASAATTVIPLAYYEALSALAHIAVNGLRRPDDLGGTITGTHSTSTGSRLPNPAYSALQAECRRLETAAVNLDRLLDQYDSGTPKRVTA